MTDPIHPVGIVRTLLVAGLQLGKPRTAGALTLVSVTGTVTGPSYLTCAEAIASGTLAIAELDGGRVPQLVVRNTGDLPVLLLDGEHLVGAKQDRVLNASVLVAARHDTVIPVSCVEQGRWGYAGADVFASGAAHAFTSLRGLTATWVATSSSEDGGRHADQVAVWEAIERERARIGAGPSPTGALRDADGSRSADLDRQCAAFAAPAPGQTGVLALAGDRVLALDAFDRHETLASVWPRLVRGYAVDALDVQEARPDMILDAARRFTAETGHPDNEATSHEGVGLGIEVIVTSPGTVSSALTWDGVVVHMASFPRTDHGGRDQRSDSEVIEHPSARARNRRRTWFRAGYVPGGGPARKDGPDR